MAFMCTDNRQEIEYELDNEVSDKFSVKVSTVRRLISELFEMNLKYMDQFFDTFPLFIKHEQLMDTLTRIFNKQDDVFPSSGESRSSNIPFKSASSGSIAGNNSESSSSLVGHDSDRNSQKNNLSDMSIELPKCQSAAFKGKRADGQNIKTTSFSLRTDDFTTSTAQSSGRFLTGGSNLVSLDSSSSIYLLSTELKVLKILSHWVTRYYTDFIKHPDIKETLTSMLNIIINEEGKYNKKSTVYTRSLLLVNTIRQYDNEMNSEAPTLTTSSNSSEAVAGTSGLDTTFDFIDKDKDSTIDKYSVDFIANGLTQLEMKLHRKLCVRELLNVAWMKENRQIVAPTILKLTEHFNHVHNIVKANILQQRKKSKRACFIEFWIRVSRHLVEINNYSGASAIISSLQSNPIFRLKKTWAKVNKKDRVALESLNTLMSAEGNYASLRNKYVSNDFIMPFLGPLLTELCYIEERLKLHTDDGRINFKKIRAISKVIGFARKSINYRMSESPDPDASNVVSKLMRTPMLAEPDFYKMSYGIEADDQTFPP